MWSSYDSWLTNPEPMESAEDPIDLEEIEMLEREEYYADAPSLSDESFRDYDLNNSVY